MVDAIAEKEPDRLCMVHLDRDKNERRFTFLQMKKDSARAANYFKALGIKKGDRVMLLLRRNWEFWPIIVGLHKLGAVAIPATDQLKQKDLEYRFQTADVKAVCCSATRGCQGSLLLSNELLLRRDRVCASELPDRQAPDHNGRGETRLAFLRRRIRHVLEPLPPHRRFHQGE